MADLTLNPANVVKGSGSATTGGTAGATVTAGQVVYVDTAVNTLKLADTDATAITAAAAGIALHGSAASQPLTYLTEGPITIGATLVAGELYVLSGTPGSICPHTDLAPGDFTTIIGIAISTTVLQVKINAGGVAHG